MPTIEHLRNIFERYKTIAVYGMSRDPGKAAQWVPSFLHSKGYNIIPINPNADKIIGRKAYHRLEEVQEHIEVLEIFRPSGQVPGVVREAVERKKKKGDIYVIWLQSGIRSDEARKLAEESDILFVEDRCMYVEFRRIFLHED
jgi:predicted CoA-binding protein